MDHDFVLPLDALVRSVGVKRTLPHALFLGAGASISSRIPSAESCIWEWKRSLFLTTNPSLEDQFAELSLPSVRQRIQAWLDKQAIYPAAGSREEYGAYIKACFPISSDRNAFFHSKIQLAQPYVGYRLLPHLAKSGLVKSVWTTNFDGLAARATSASGVTAIEIGLDSQSRIDRVAGANELLCISLHGDYRYDELKNTEDEIRLQETHLSSRLVEELQNRSLIVCGYSGRDASIMDTLKLAYSKPGSGVLYWCGHGDGNIPDSVESLVATARANGRNSFYIPAQGFDDLMTRLSLHCLEGDAKEAVKKEIVEHSRTSPLVRSPFTVPDCIGSTLIKSNAFELQCPGEVFSFEPSSWPQSKVWAWLREKTAGHDLVAVPFKGKVLALGAAEIIKACFPNEIKGSIERTPVTPTDLAYEDGAVTNLMREALVKAISRRLNIASDGKSELWASEPKKKVREGNIMCHVHDSIFVSLRRFGSTQYCVIKPSIKVVDQTGAEVPREIAGPVKLAILGYQHNKPFNDIMNYWRSQLFATTEPFAEFEFPAGIATAFKFRVRKAPVLAKIGRKNENTNPVLPKGAQPLVRYSGIEIAEPSLLFCDKQGRSLNQDTHPVRGLAANRPYDYPLTIKGLAPSLRIGVICPSKETAVVRSYLLKANQMLRPADSERDYLVDYPGFQQAFGLPIEIPEPQAAGWVNCAEPTAFGEEAGSLSVAQQITTSIEKLHSSFAPNVILIFFPKRWQHLQGYKGEHEHFDVHDFVKAYAVQRGVATQFLSEETVSDQQQCRVWWWLSLALYVKGMRTPWVLSGLDADTAYVGLGFSIDQNAERGKHVVLGCSHIYSARGEGLQYRLSKVENPIMRGKNPFMSRDDARRTGETIRQLFFDAHWKLPRRVVLHKRTPFIRDEREGLLDGLSGVEVLDMLEVVHEPAVRYVASVVKSGQIDGDGYPVRRGTVLKLDDHTAQLWIHGATAALNPRLKYFQGKRRIPAPLTIHQHAGSSSLETLSAEILGLSKMNWNTFDLYTKLPATLQSSSEIAKIGSLLQRFGASSYDYRLFI